jgi:hypothetical protein
MGQVSINWKPMNAPLGNPIAGPNFLRPIIYL